MEQEKAFDPTVHLTTITGKGGEKLYLPAAARVLWFREEYGIETGWEIRTACVEGSFKDGYAVYRAEIVNPEGRVVATGTNAEDKQGFQDFVMKAETGSIARALALCGYGTMAAMDEGEIVDTPIQRGTVQKPAQSQRANPAPAREQSRARGSSAPVGAAPGGGSPPPRSLAARADASAVAPVEFCEDCGQQIEGIETKKGPVTVATMVAISEKRWGKALCHPCGKKRMDVEQANLPTGELVGA